MSILSRFFRRLGLGDPQPGTGGVIGALPEESLVEEPRVSATQLGSEPRIMPWSVGRLLTIIRNYASDPNPVTLRQVRLARQSLSQFWLVAPVDQLELLYRSSIGECYRELLAGQLAREPLLPQEQAWRDQLAQRLMRAFDRPETANLLLAVFGYFPPGRMRVDNPLTQVPRWLQEDYARLFDPELLQRIWRPAGLLAPAGQALGQAPSLGLGTTTGLSQPQPVQQQAVQQPRPQPLQVGSKRGAAALALVQDDGYQNRMAGLINLHVIDPADAEVAGQLAGLRRQLAQVWLDARADQLEALYRSRFGELYRNLLASGYVRSEISEGDRNLRRQLAQRVADMSRPGAIQALLAVLPFYPPGKISFGGGEQHMPVWLVREIARLDPSAKLGQPGGQPSPEATAVSGETPAR
jgi:hypothetical protein